MRHISVKCESNILNQKGFTLLELLAVMVIVGVMSSVAVKKMELVSDTAADRALILGIKELNVREHLTWAKIKISDAGWQNDSDVFAEIDTNLAGCSWTFGPAAAGGTLRLRSQSAVLIRSASTATSAGRWN